MSLRRLLVQEGLVPAQDLAFLLALSLGLPFVDPRHFPMDSSITSSLPATSARSHLALPLTLEGEALLVAMAEPDDFFALQDMEAWARRPIRPAVAPMDEVEEGLNRLYPTTEEARQALQEDGRLQAGVVVTAPAVKALDLLLTQAVWDRASDVHLEPQKGRLRIRFRIDGILHDIMDLPLDLHPPLLSRVKVLANMDIAERRKPQDGQFTITVDNRTVDIRVATVGTIHGEKAVLRLLDTSFALLDLSQLGFLPESYEKFRQLLQSPYGLLLVCGPTGAGKTTTLYAALNALDRRERHIITIEDPVEYKFQDITQRQRFLSGASADEVKNQALQEGLITLRQDGMRKVKAGTTSSSKVLRAVFAF